MFKPLNPLIHSPLRLSIMSLLVNVASADFNYLKEITQASNGNISVQIQKLNEANYLTIEKTFKDNYPNTSYTITKEGKDAFEEYILSMKSYFESKK